MIELFDPSARFQKTDYISPHKISLLILIDQFCRNEISGNLAQRVLVFLIKNIRDAVNFVEPQLSKLLLDLNQIDTEAEEHQGLSNLLVGKLRSFQSPDHLHEFFQELKSLIMPPQDGVQDDIKDRNHKLLNKQSLFGIFVRKSRLNFDKLLFEEVCQLYLSLTLYISESSAGDIGDICKDNIGSLGGLSGLDSIRIMGVNVQLSGFLSLYDTERFLDSQVEQLEKSTLRSSPLQVQRDLTFIQRHIPDMAKVYYVSCLNCIRAHEFEGALQNLHRFFDYCMANRDRAMYQYALLNLAILQSKFGNHEEALWALRGAIEIARENHDKECLSYALGWLYRFKDQSSDQNGGEASEKQMLDSLVGRTKELNLLLLQSLSELAKSKKTLQNGNSPVEVFEAAFRSSSLNTDFSLEGVTATAHLFNSSIWDTYGNQALSSLFCQLQTTYHDEETIPEEAITAHCKLALQHAFFGNYDEALDKLLSIKQKLSIEGSPPLSWIHCTGMILHQRALDHEEFANAEVLEAQLSATCRVGTEEAMEVEFRKAIRTAKVGHPAQALSILYKLLGNTTKLDSQSHVLSAGYMLKLAEIHLDSHTPISALPLLLSCLSLSKRFNLQNTFLMATIHLSDVLLNFNLAQQARDTIERVVPKVLAHGSLYLQAKMHFTYARALLSCSNDEKEEISSIDQSIIDHLQDALDGFWQLESTNEILAVLYFQARIFHHSENKNERDKAIKEYRQLSEKVAHSRTMPPNPNLYYFPRDLN